VLDVIITKGNCQLKILPLQPS